MALSYNSLVWTKRSNSISFNDDNGFPGPGFRLGFRLFSRFTTTVALMGNQLNCTKIKDRNGNYINIDYVSGRLDKVIDSLGREIKFNYETAFTLLTREYELWAEQMWPTLASVIGAN